MIDLHLFGDRGFAAPVAVLFLGGAALFGALTLVPLWIQQVHGASALAAGLLLAPQGLGMGIALLLGGRLTDRLPPRPLVLSGLSLAGLSTLAFTNLGAATDPVFVGAALLVSGLGLGITLVPVMTVPMRALAPARIPRASVAIRIFQQLGGSFAGAVVAVVLHLRLVAAGGAGEAVAAAYAGTFWWPLGALGLALIAALFIPPGAGRSGRAR